MVREREQASADSGEGHINSLVQRLAAVRGLPGIAAAVAHHAVATIDEADFSGVISYRHGIPHPAGVTHSVVTQLLEFQLEGHPGPLWEALGTRAPVSIKDTWSDIRWPHFRDLAGALGVHSVLDVPLIEGSRFEGVLSLCSRRPRAFTKHDIADAKLIALHATPAIAAAHHEQS